MDSQPPSSQTPRSSSIASSWPSQPLPASRNVQETSIINAQPIEWEIKLSIYKSMAGRMAKDNHKMYAEIMNSLTLT